MGTPGRRHGKYRQTARVLRLLEYLRARRFGATLAELAAEIGVTERQVRRDLDALDEAGFAPESTTTSDGTTRYKVAGASGRAIPLTRRERYGLLAVRRVFDVLEGTPLAEDVRSIYSKVAASLPDKERGEIESLGDRFLFVPDGGTKIYRKKDDVLDGLLTGVIHRVRVRYRYRPASGSNDESRGLLEPYAMVLYKNGLYVVGRGTPDGADAAERKPFVFAVERFVRAEHQKGDHFEVPPDFRIERYFDGAFGLFRGGEPEHVVIDFSPDVRPAVEARRWHRTQKLKALPDGGVRLTFDIANMTSLVSWVLEWGPKARVREPRSLVERVTAELRLAAARYGRE